MCSARFLAFTLAAVGLLSACGEDPKPKTQATVAPVVAPVAPPSVPPPVTGSLTPRYEATLSEGIDFRKPGYPSFVAEVSGMGEREDWGRWTDGPAAKFRFQQPLPGKFTLQISAGAIGPNFDKPIVVRVGNVRKEFIIKAPTAATTPAGVSAFALDFDNSARTDTIEIIPFKPTRPMDINPKSDDTRALGAALVSLKVR